MAEILVAQLQAYGLSRESGFVPDESSQRLASYYDAWEDNAASLANGLRQRSLLAAIRSIPNLTTRQLVTEADWQRAYVLLAFLVHGIVHGCGQRTVPSKLAEPFLHVCDHLGMQPVVSYAGLCLFNWSDSGNRSALSGLRCIASFTGTLDEEAFNLVPVLVERVGGRLPAQLLEALIAADAGDWLAVVDSLDVCSNTLGKMVAALNELKLCVPKIFYHDIRPYIAGLNVDFEKENGDVVHVDLVGGSAGQSSLFQFLDHVLGVRHSSKLLMEMRSYMPRRHREFLERVEALPSLRELAERDDAGAEVCQKLGECRGELKKWRDKHISIVTRYILLPAQAAARKTKGVSMEIVGTAGSSPVAFLKQVRDETVMR